MSLAIGLGNLKIYVYIYSNNWNAKWLWKLFNKHFNYISAQGIAVRKKFVVGTTLPQMVKYRFLVISVIKWQIGLRRKPILNSNYNCYCMDLSVYYKLKLFVEIARNRYETFLPNSSTRILVF